MERREGEKGGWYVMGSFEGKNEVAVRQPCWWRGGEAGGVYSVQPMESGVEWGAARTAGKLCLQAGGVTQSACRCRIALARAKANQHAVVCNQIVQNSNQDSASSTRTCC